MLVDTEDKIVPSFTMVTAEEWLELLILGGMGLVGFFALTRYGFLLSSNMSGNRICSRSLQLIPPTTVAVLRAMEIVLAYGVQAVVLGEVRIAMYLTRIVLRVQVPNSLAIAGSSLVIISVVAFAAENIFFSCLGRMIGCN